MPGSSKCGATDMTKRRVRHASTVLAVRYTSRNLLGAILALSRENAPTLIAAHQHLPHTAGSLAPLLNPGNRRKQLPLAPAGILSQTRLKVEQHCLPPR